MTMRLFITSAATALAFGAIAGFGPPAHAAGGVPASWLPAELGLVGVWDVTVNIVDCTSGAIRKSFPAMNQFGIDGSESEVGAGTPPSQRYPSFGSWTYSGPRQFESNFVFYRFDAGGNYLGTQEVQRTIRLSLDANQFDSTAKVWVYDPAHHLQNPPYGCATEHAVHR